MRQCLGWDLYDETTRLARGLKPDEVIVEQKLVEGGISDIWFVRNPCDNRGFVLKYSREPSFENPYLFGQFERERQCSDYIHRYDSHPIMPCIYDGGIDEKGCCYLYESFFYGIGLDEVLDLPWTWKKMRVLISWIVKVMERFHRLGVVHRDIKPSNILISRIFIDEAFKAERKCVADDGELVGASIRRGEKNVCFIDFSLATIGGEAHPNHRERCAYGTPIYCSPEQALAQSVDFMSDWYSLGIAFYEWISGCVPFRHANVQEILLMQVQGGVPQLVNRRIEALPEEFVEAVLWLLKKNPLERIRGVEMLKSILET